MLQNQTLNGNLIAGDILVSANGTVFTVNDSLQEIAFSTTYNSITNSTMFEIDGTTCYIKFGDVDGNGNDTEFQLIDGFDGGVVHSKANLVSLGGSATLLANQFFIHTSGSIFTLSDSTATLSVDVENRALYDSAGTLQVMWTPTGIRMPTLPAYDDDTAAGVGGLVTGDFYQTTGAGALTTPGIVMIKQ